MLFASKIWPSTLLMKSGNHYGIAWRIRLSGLCRLQLKREEIRERVYDCKSYPTNEDITSCLNNSWVPHHLQIFLKHIVVSEVKQNSISQAIIQASRPRSVIAPVMFGVGVEMDHVFGSKWLINELSHLGFSISYDEVVRYKQSVIQSETLENLLSEYFPGTFTQWVGDNVDHNVLSLDGQGSFRYGNYSCFLSKKYSTT